MLPIDLNDAATVRTLAAQSNELAGRYARGEKDLQAKVFAVITFLTEDYFRGRISASRKTLTGVPGYKDEFDLLAEVARRVFKKLDSGSYADDGKFSHFVLFVAKKVFLSALAWKKKKPGPEGADAEADEHGLKPKGEANHPHVEFSEVDASVMADDETRLIEKEMLNLILNGLRAACGEVESDVFVARALLGKSEKEIQALYGLKADTTTSHYRRACVKILEHIHAHSDYKELPLKGLRLLVQKRIAVEERDLELLADESHRKALRLAAAGPLSLRALAAELGMTPKSAQAVLRAAIVALSKAQVRRAKEAVQTVKAPNLEAWLWDAVGEMLAVYPEAPAQVRGLAVAVEDQELAALSQTAVYLGFDRVGVAPPRTMAELAEPLLARNGTAATEAALGLKHDELMDLLSGGVKPEDLQPLLLKNLAAHFECDAETLNAALRASASPQPGGRTRGLTAEERARLLDGVRRRVLGGSKPA